MQKQLTNISCIASLLIIFIVAAIHQNHFSWVAGIIALLILLTVRNFLGEVALSTEIRLTVISWGFLIATLLFLI